MPTALWDLQPWEEHRVAWDPGRVFVACNLTIPVTAAQAQARFVKLAQGTWLTGVSEAAYQDGRTGLLKVGPPVPVAAKLVRVTVAEPVYRDGTMIAGIRWEATGPAGALFPVLDANLTVSPHDPGTPAEFPHARLEIIGTYRPPLGRLGTVLDRVILHEVANATIRALLRTVAASLTSPGTAAEGAHYAPSQAAARPEPLDHR